MVAGRKPINDPNDIDAIEEKIKNYFALCIAMHKPYTQSGLTKHLGYSSVSSLREWMHKDVPISGAIKKAMLDIDIQHEENLFSNSCTGSIFYLKNRGWTDKQQIEHSGKIETIPFSYIEPNASTD